MSGHFRMKLETGIDPHAFAPIPLLHRDSHLPPHRPCHRRIKGGTGISPTAPIGFSCGAIQRDRQMAYSCPNASCIVFQSYDDPAANTTWLAECHVGISDSAPPPDSIPDTPQQAAELTVCEHLKPTLPGSLTAPGTPGPPAPGKTWATSQTRQPPTFRVSRTQWRTRRHV